MVHSMKLSLQTRGNADTHDITDAVAHAVGQSGLKSGTVTLFCPGSTSGLTTIEFEPGAVADLQQVFDEVVPPNRDYRHNERWGDGNGHSTSAPPCSAPPSPSPSSTAGSRWGRGSR